MSNEYKDWTNDLKNAQEGTPDYNRWLCMEYPFLIPRNRFTDKEIENYDYTWTELDAMPSGWKKTFGVQMCEEIAKVLKKADYLYDYRITQIKEKWGELCWYDRGAPGIIHDELCDIIEKYQDLSRTICCVCGAPAEYVTTSWIGYYCDEHSKNDRSRVTIKRYEEMLNELYHR